MSEREREFEFTRRQVLTAGMLGATGLVGAAALPGCSSGSTEQRSTTTCAPGAKKAALSQIEHVVIIMQENRSFDHYFGSLRGVRGFDDHPPGAPGVFAQLAPAGQTGTRSPFHLDTATTNASCTNDVTHDWGPQHQCWNNGAMDQWARVHAVEDGAGGADGAVTMGYYTRADLDYLYALADTFTVCDAYHCSVMGPTDPNRLYSMSAMIDPDGTHGGPPIANNPDIADTKKSKFSRAWTTMPERLSTQGVSWKVYQQPLVDKTELSLLVSNNPLFFFRQFSDPTSDMYHQAFLNTWPDDFAHDVATGNLPSVSWVLAPPGQDEHPPSSPQVGEYFTSRVMATLMSAPAAWAKTVAFLTYDENGGFFDHMAPMTPPPGTPGEFVTSNPLPSNVKGIAGPIGLGFRVPMVVVSPFSRGGYVCSDLADHTSTLRFLETRFGVEVPNLSAWRRSVTGDLTSTLDMSAPDTTIPTLPQTSLNPPAVARGCPPNEIFTPVATYPVPANPPKATQEPGTAKRRFATACAKA